MIEHGPYNQILKTGVFFSVASGPDQVYTGDLFYDMRRKEFQIRGIPSIGHYKRHCFDHDFKGPVSLDLVVLRVLEESFRETDKYVDLRFVQAKALGELAAQMEEFEGTRVCLPAIEANWQIVGDLTWFRA